MSSAATAPQPTCAAPRTGPSAASSSANNRALRRRVAPVRRNTAVADVVREKVAATDGRISAMRLLPLARAAAYAGSARNIDELGFAPLDLTGASYWPFEEWCRFFPETVTTMSLLDRVLHHATVVVTSGESFRMREARSRATPRSRRSASRSADAAGR